MKRPSIICERAQRPFVTIFLQIHIISGLIVILCCLCSMNSCNKENINHNLEKQLDLRQEGKQQSIRILIKSTPRYQNKDGRGITDVDIKTAIENYSLFHDKGEIRIAFENSKEKTLALLQTMAIEQCSSELSTLVGYLFASTGDQSGEQWIQDNLEGNIREWAKVGYGVELANMDFEKLKSYLLRIPANNARDNLVVYGIITIAKVDKEEALRLYISEFDNISAGSSMASSQAAYALLEKFLNEESRDDLLRRLHSDDFSLVIKGRESAVAWQISRSDPELAIQWAVEQGVDQESLERLLPRFLKYAGQSGNPEIIACSSEYYSKIAPSVVPSESLVRLLLDQDASGVARENMIEDAKTFLRNLPDTELSASAHQVFLKEYASIDSKAAVRWIEAMPLGVRRDHSIAGMLESGSVGNIQYINYWIQQIDDAAVRKATSSKFDIQP
jgi:hypothetical protein